MAKSTYIPNDITLVDPETGNPMKDGEKGGDVVVSFARFLRQTVMQDTRWGQNAEWIWSAGTILSALRASNESKVLVLDDEHHNRLAEVAKAPTRSNGFGQQSAYTAVYNPIVLPQFQPFLEALGVDGSKK